MEIFINGFKWNVLFVHAKNSMLMRSDNTYALGVTDRNEQYIAINKHLYGNLAYKVLVHEICHAICLSYGIYMSVEEEERLCDFVATHGSEAFELAEEIERALLKRGA